MKDSRISALLYDLFMGPVEVVLSKRWRRRLWEDLQGPLILDAGAGTGMNAPFYPEMSRVIAIDINQSAMERTQRRIQGKDVRMMIGDVTYLPFVDGAFDTVVASFLFCSVDETYQGLAELRRVLKPGGELRLLEHGRSRGAMGNLINLFSEPLYRMFGEQITQDMEVACREIDFSRVESEHLLKDVVKIIRAKK